MEKKATTRVKINELIARRWSARAFDTNREVEGWKIISLFEAARWAPSCGGDEPWRFVLWNRFTSPVEFQKAFETLDEGNKKWVRNAPILIGVFAYKKWRGNSNEVNHWAQFDTGASAMSLYLQAFDVGLYAHPMAGFDAKKLVQEFNIPEMYEPMAMIAVGYPGNPDSLESPYREREFQARRRRPLEENFFVNFWGNSINVQQIIGETVNV